MKKSKFISTVLILGLLLSGSFEIGFAYVNIVGPSNLVLSNIQQPSGSGSFADSFLIIGANQKIQITFNTTGDLRRQELDQTGSGLGRYDTLGTTILRLRVRGMSAMEFNWDGSMNDLNGLTTPAITPSANEKIWMDLDMNATSNPINLGDSQWYESDDAGIYQSTLIMTVVGLPPPSP